MTKRYKYFIISLTVLGCMGQTRAFPLARHVVWSAKASAERTLNYSLLQLSSRFLVAVDTQHNLIS